MPPDPRPSTRIGLRTRLLAFTVPVTVAAVVLAGWVANRQTRQAIRHEVTAELVKPSKIEQNLRGWVNANHGSWDGVEGLVDDLSADYDVRIVLRDAGLVIADSGGSPNAPTETAFRIEPPPSDRFRAVKQEIQSDAVDKAIDCFEANGIGFEEHTDPQTGLRGVAATIDNKSPEHAAEKITACQKPLNEAQDNLKIFDAGDQAFRPIDVALDRTGIESGALLSGGVSTRLVLTLAAVALVTALVTVAIARWLTGPIVALTRAVRRMTKGHLDERVPEGRSDELGELSRAFNSMAESLAAGDRLRRRMTSDIAHELRTPLSNIRGYLEAAQDGVAPLTSELIDSIHEDTLLLQALVDDLQELAAAESGHLRLERVPTDLDDLVASVAAAHQARAVSAGIELTVEAGLRTPADIDARRIRQVLTNLVENALRHTDGGGRITLTTRATGGQAEVAVRDSGVGIDPQDLPHVFDRFYRADPSRQRATGGSGLGLAISRELVAAHGGALTVASTVGEGTVFTVRLPLVEGSQPLPPPDRVPEAGSPPSPPSPPSPRPPRTPAPPPARTWQPRREPVDFTYIDVS